MKQATYTIAKWLALFFIAHGCAAFIPSPAGQETRNQNGNPQYSLFQMMRGDHDDNNAHSDFPGSNGQQLSRSAFLSSSLMAALAVTVSAVSPEEAQAAPTTPTSMTQPTIAANTKDINDSNSNSQTLEESISGFIAGAALSTTKTVVKYPLDTATVRLQMPASQYSIFEPLALLNGSFRGIATPLVSNIPAGAIFFAVKDATKEFLKSNGGANLPRWASTSLAVLAATFPYMAIRNPSEVIKTRLQAGVDGYGEGVSALEAFQKVQQGSNATTNGGGIAGDFYVGYWENVCYTYPADVLKFVAYENLTGGRKNLPPAEGALYGAAATAMAQFITTPLDVVRNRVMARKTSDNCESGERSSEDPPSYVESLSTIAREEGLKGLFAGTSPRVGKAILSGAIQFATYEETKQAIAKSFQSNKSR